MRRSRSATLYCSADRIDWIHAPAPTPYAATYIIAWHGVTDDATCDQADPARWRFYVVPTTKLPETNTVTLATLKGMGPADGYGQDTLPAVVEVAREAVTLARR